ncbi:hypothetical protein HMPREF1870_01956 [Bacteroidales bacterium KA00344]|nr:hypothetical protein HMPREF1870_01956 [Bacteroidales bacterium KA00344]
MHQFLIPNSGYKYVKIEKENIIMVIIRIIVVRRFLFLLLYD